MGSAAAERDLDLEQDLAGTGCQLDPVGAVADHGRVDGVDRLRHLSGGVGRQLDAGALVGLGEALELEVHRLAGLEAGSGERRVTASAVGGRDVAGDDHVDAGRRRLGGSRDGGRSETCSGEGECSKECPRLHD